jgi:hypothetical protein
MVAVYGNLMVMGVAVALFVATINLGKKRVTADEADAPVATTAPVTDPPT